MLYDQIVEQCRPYLGLATEAFVNRQLVNNMKLPRVEDFKEQHLEVFIKWCLHSGREVLSQSDLTEMVAALNKLESSTFIKNLFRQG